MVAEEDEEEDEDDARATQRLGRGEGCREVRRMGGDWEVIELRAKIGFRVGARARWGKKAMACGDMFAS